MMVPNPPLRIRFGVRDPQWVNIAQDQHNPSDTGNWKYKFDGSGETWSIPHASYTDAFDAAFLEWRRTRTNAL